MESPPDSDPDRRGGDEILDSAAFRTGRWVLGGLAGAYGVSTLLPTGSKPAWVDTWFYGAVIMAVTLAGLIRPLVVRRDRLPWLLLSLAAIAWAVGDQYWSVMFAGADTVPVPSPADAGYLGLYPLAYVGLILLARSVLRRVPASVLLDGLVTSLAVGALFSAFTVTQIISGVDGSGAEVITNLSYPVGDLILIVVAVATLAMVRRRADRSGGCWSPASACSRSPTRPTCSAPTPGTSTVPGSTAPGWSGSRWCRWPGRCGAGPPGRDRGARRAPGTDPVLTGRARPARGERVRRTCTRSR